MISYIDVLSIPTYIYAGIILTCPALFSLQVFDRQSTEDNLINFPEDRTYMDLEDPDSIYNSPVLEDDIANLGRGTGKIPALKPIRDWPDDNKLDDDELIILEV